MVYDLATNTTTRLTNDALRDVDPEVSEDGNAVVFQKTDLSGVNSDVYLSVQTFPGVWSTTNISANSADKWRGGIAIGLQWRAVC